MKQFKVLIFLSFVTALLFVSCSEHIVSECEPGVLVETSMRASFAEIQEQVLTPSCALSGCHVGSFAFSPILNDAEAYNNLIGVNNLAGNMELVKPGDSNNSFLIKKLNGDGTTVMPSGGPKLDKAIIDSIAAWIDNGAENN